MFDLGAFRVAAALGVNGTGHKNPANRFPVFPHFTPVLMCELTGPLWMRRLPDRFTHLRIIEQHGLEKMFRRGPFRSVQQKAVLRIAREWIVYILARNIERVCWRSRKNTLG
jgi:hypothetical protein